jgi:hypothetical protein
MIKKSNISKVTALAVFTLILHSCEIDSVKDINDTKPTDFEVSGVSFNCLKGVLHFKTHDDFIAVANYLNSSGISVQMQLFEELGFKSQEMIFQEIGKAEDLFNNQFYKDVDEDISVEDLNKMQLGIEYSTLFKSYQDKGFLKVIKEEDGSESYYPNTINPSLMSVLSEEGFVIVNGLLMQYTDRNIKFTPFNSISQLDVLKDAKGANEEKGISIIEFYNTKKSYVTHIDSTVRKYKGSNLRVSSRYAVWDGEVHGELLGTGLIIYINHIIELKAEEKRWGKWGFRNNYMPLTGLVALWETCVKFGFYYVFCDITQNDVGVKNSPVNLNPFPNGSTNYYKFNPSPVGWISYSNELYSGIVQGFWSLTVPAALIDDPDNSGSY